MAQVSSLRSQALKSQVSGFKIWVSDLVSLNGSESLLDLNLRGFFAEVFLRFEI